MNSKAVSIFLVFLVPACLLISACDSLLDEEPQDFYGPENFYQSEEDAVAAVNAAYNALTTQYLILWVNSDALPSDDRVLPTYVPFDRLHALDDYTFGPENTEMLGFWTNYYTAVNRANAVINRVPDIDMDPDRRAELVGQGLFIRAFQYFELVRDFGEVPLILDDNLDALQIEVESAPANEVYEQIISDFQRAEEMLPASYPPSDAGRATSGAATAFLAKVYLTMASEQANNVHPDWNYAESAQAYYQLAAQKAEEVINSGNYSLFEDYRYNFDLEHENGEEHLFSFQMSRDNFSNPLARLFLPAECDIIPGGAEAEHTPEMEFYNVYEEGSYRQEVNFLTECTNAAGETVTYEDFQVGTPVIGKYFDETIDPLANRGVNKPILRYADVLLMHAEALNELGRTSEAYQYINMVRERARNGNPDLPPQDIEPGSLTQSEFRDAVYLERRLELAFEGIRKDDLDRTGRLIEAMKKPGINGGDNVQPHHVLFPKPITQLQLNPLLEQNPGY